MNLYKNCHNKIFSYLKCFISIRNINKIIKNYIIILKKYLFYIILKYFVTSLFKYIKI